MRFDFDVAILGGGPAGMALAIALRGLGRSVAVFERTRYERPRAGETFGGELGPLLQTLGVWDAFGTLAPVAFRGVRSAWGGPELAERASMLHPFGDGWHVERTAFDRCFAECAVRAGASVMLGAGACGLERLAGGASGSEAGFRVRPAEGPAVSARQLVDASGRGAPATALHFAERRWLRADRLVALIGKLAAPSTPVEPLLLLEAVEEGWWYSVPQPDGSLLAALMTDADLLPARGRAALAGHHSAALARTLHTAERAAGATLACEPYIARADSGVLLPDRGPAFCAVGDAAFACDPLAGDGVVRSLRAALDAAPRIHAELDGQPQPGDPSALHQRFGDYLEMRGRYYAREPRWPAAPFWARRRPIGWQTAPLFLDPRRPLRTSGASLSREAAAPIESLLPPAALRALLDKLREPLPAHAALGWLKSAAPLEDKRLLVALHYLVHTGAVLAG